VSAAVGDMIASHSAAGGFMIALYKLTVEAVKAAGRLKKILSKVEAV
jgi:hypothetical protein